MPDLLTPAEVAALLRCKPATVARYVTAGLPVIRLSDRCHRFDRAAVLASIDQHRAA